MRMSINLNAINFQPLIEAGNKLDAAAPLALLISRDEKGSLDLWGDAFKPEEFIKSLPRAVEALKLNFVKSDAVTNSAD